MENSDYKLFSKVNDVEFFLTPTMASAPEEGRRLPVYSVYLDTKDNVSTTGKDIDLFASMDLAMGVSMREDISRAVTRLL